MQLTALPAPGCKPSRTPLRLAAMAVALVLAVSGCTPKAPVRPENSGEPRDDTAPGTARGVPQVESVFLGKSQLWLSYSAGDGLLHASAATDPASQKVLTATGKGNPVRELVPVAAEAMAAEQPAGTAVTVLAPEAWQTLLDASLLALAPAADGCGAVVDILHEDELFLYRLQGTALVAVPLAYKPPELQVTQTYSFADLLEVIGHRLAGDYPAADRLLFETGDDSRFGYPFVYADTGSGQLLFLQQAPDAAAAGPARFGSTLEIFAHTVVDHIRALFNQPVTSVSRLFTLVTATTADFARPAPLALLEHEPVPPLNRGAGMDLAQWEAELDLITGKKTSAGHLTYHVGGTEFFPRLIDLVGSAGESVYLRVYIFDNDDYAVEIADLLKRRSADIDVRVLVDGLGTRGAGMARPPSMPAGQQPKSSILHYLAQDSAVHVRTVPNVWLTGDHTKTILIDGTTAFLGGMNIGREYRYDWHDLMVEVEGPVVSEIAGEFRRAWTAAGLLGDLRKLFQRSKSDATAPGESDYPVRLLYTRPADSEILRAHIAATRRARSHIFLENPYLTSDAMLYELLKARRRGVDVRVIMPYRNDSGLIARSNVLAANTMIRNGIRVYIYPGMSHLKAAMYDGWASLGSANMDRLSLRTNREMNLATSHAAAVDTLYERVFAADMERSVELTEPLPSNWSDHLAELLADYL